jgi:hypothetical protein
MLAVVKFCVAVNFSFHRILSSFACSGDSAWTSGAGEVMK